LARTRISPPPDHLEPLRRDPATAGLFVDFDGTLADIVERPDDARPVEGAGAALSALARRYAVVAVITGRRAEEVVGLLGTEGVRYEGVYGLQEGAEELALAVVAEVERAAAVEPAAWVEEKGASVAVHYRAAADPDLARRRLLGALAPVASASGLELAEGKRVVELVPAGRPRKGGTVERIAGELELRSVLYAGDDVADLDAFAGLDRLASHGLAAVRVAVRSAGTPEELVAAADVVAEGPAGMLELLRGLAG
jgi:trehalose 6-phosphate phosphatase